MNRGSKLGEDAVSLARAASMRPRFMNRGSPRDLGFPARSGARFNEAPIHESGK